MRGSRASLVRFGGQNLLLCHGFGLGLLRLCLLARGFLRGGYGFLLHALSFGLSLLRLGASLFRLSPSLFSLGARCFCIYTPFGFGFRICAGFGFTRRGGRLRFIFRLLLHCHEPRFFRGLGGFLGRGSNCCLVLLLPVEFFRMHQLLVGLRQNGTRVLVPCRDMRDAHRVARLKQLQRSLGIDSEDRVLNVRVRRGVRAARYQFVLGVDVLAAAAHRSTLHHHHVPGLRHRKIGLRSNDHSKRLQVGVRLHVRVAVVIKREFAQIDWAPLRRNCPRNIR